MIELEVETVSGSGEAPVSSVVVREHRHDLQRWAQDREAGAVRVDPAQEHAEGPVLLDRTVEHDRLLVGREGAVERECARATLTAEARVRPRAGRGEPRDDLGADSRALRGHDVGV